MGAYNRFISSFSERIHRLFSSLFFGETEVATPRAGRVIKKDRSNGGDVVLARNSENTCLDKDPAGADPRFL